MQQEERNEDKNKNVKPFGIAKTLFVMQSFNEGERTRKVRNAMTFFPAFFRRSEKFVGAAGKREKGKKGGKKAR